MNKSTKYRYLLVLSAIGGFCYGFLAVELFFIFCDILPIL